MKVVLIILVLIGTAIAAPNKAQKHNLGFRNLYKKPVVEAKSVPSGRIVGGKVAEPHSIPFQVFIEFYTWGEGWSCGGSLITPKYVLTAAHCGEEALEAYVLLGAQNIDEDEDSQVIMVSYKIIVHEQYDTDDISYDIALVRLPEPAPLSNNINVVPLPTRADVNNNYVGKMGKVSGWGLVDGRDEDLSSVLRYTENPIISNRECQNIYGVVQDYQICMSGDDGKSSCSGDSGGPFTVDGVLVGIVSYGAEYCEPGYPSAFTRTTSFLEWIAQNSDLQLS